MQALSVHPSSGAMLRAQRPQQQRAALPLLPQHRRGAVAAAPLRAPMRRGDDVACEALGLGAITAGVSKVLTWVGIKGSANAAVAGAVGSAASAAVDKAAALAAVKVALKYLVAPILGLVAASAALGALAYHLGAAQFVRAAWNKLAGRGGLTLWTNPASRGQIVAWYLREIDASDLVNPVNLDMKEKREHKAPAFLAVNPFGKVPALSDGGFHLFESGALMLYAADRFPLRSGIRTPQQRAAAAQWVLFANSTLANALFVDQFREKAMPDVLSSLDALLATREWLEEGRFTVSDVAVGSYLLYATFMLADKVSFAPYPHVSAYVARLLARPACQATVGSRAGAASAPPQAAPAPAAQPVAANAA